MTSIEWLIKELYTEMNMSGDGRVFDEILEEAKEMHKKELFEYWQGGINCTEEGGKSFDQYYQETFVSKGSDDHISDISKMVDVPKQETLYTEEQVREAIEDARDIINHVNTDEVIKSLRQHK